MKILAIDTALQALSVCVLQNSPDIQRQSETIQMARGQAEALMPTIERVLSKAQMDVSHLDRIAVTIGPGSFTGIRVGLAAAKALGRVCQKPVLGISTLAVLAAPLIEKQQGDMIVSAIDARHDHIYMQVYTGTGRSIFGPKIISLRDAIRMIGSGPIQCVGNGSTLLAHIAEMAGIKAQIIEESSIPKIEYVGRLGMLADPQHAIARPLYLKAPDAKVMNEPSSQMAPA
ncbi:MAG: tRNA (adenosine(37)-N6)-threonylcarbamoyltransferase complex dimerization subunit type 1 TsaB [Methylocystaceae bacterium]|nr:tRNA (adenosine(37)-N6)-threonylcarbamoyltransferase complex dimerization subunit type 1 TsaB [Methylocystaceae bacterium]